jgi:hypothetical protein
MPVGGVQDFHLFLSISFYLSDGTPNCFVAERNSYPGVSFYKDSFLKKENKTENSKEMRQKEKDSRKSSIPLRLTIEKLNITNQKLSTEIA